jgi:hypothetical protein
VLLDDAEQAVVAAADARAATLRSRPLRLWVGRPGAAVTVTQTRHAFAFGFPIDFREFESAPKTSRSTARSRALTRTSSSPRRASSGASSSRRPVSSSSISPTPSSDGRAISASR